MGVDPRVERIQEAVDRYSSDSNDETSVRKALTFATHLQRIAQWDLAAARARAVSDLVVERYRQERDKEADTTRGGPRPAPRWFWWPAERLTFPWRPFLWGGDEWARRTLGVRVPGGMLFLLLWRFSGWSGPCLRCGQWEPDDEWKPPRCTACTRELADYAEGCICPSFMIGEVEYDDWPTPGCPVHKQREPM